MKVAVLLSAGRHPVSGEAVLPRVEAQAVRLGAALGELTGLHAGPTPHPASDALGHGLKTLVHLKGDDDPVPSLAAALQEAAFDLVLTGRCSQGQDETGLVPYALADALGCPLIADAIALAPGRDLGTIVIEQALEKGARRRLVVRTPCVVTVHPNAPAPQPFAYGQARRGRTIVPHQAAVQTAGLARIQVEERPYRARPKMMRGAPSGGSAAERLKAATGMSDAATTNVLVAPSKEDAAQAILAYLRSIGVLAPSAAERKIM